MGLKVLVVDDSAVVRQTLSDILLADRDIDEVVTAQDPYVAAARLRQFVPDVITLDVEMPRMDGLSFLQKIMSQHPIPVVMCSSLTETNSETALRAMEYGAVDIIQKPRMGTKQRQVQAAVAVKRRQQRGGDPERCQGLLPSSHGPGKARLSSPRY